MKKPADSRDENLATFLGFTIENIDKFYNKKFQTWLYRNSHSTEKIETDPDEPFFRKYDSDGNIINAKFSCTTKDGILLTEKDFINSEVSILNNLEASTLPFEDKKRIEFYKNFLISKLTSDEPGQEKVNSEINLHPDIFTNKIGYSIFERINKKFISQKETHLANYSFLFYALQKDNFLLCTPTEFKNFLSDNFQIELDKIDTRQSGKSKKTILYEAIKEQITGIAQ